MQEILRVYRCGHAVDIEPQIRVIRGLVLRWLDGFRNWWWLVVVFTNFVDDLQLGAKFLITAELDIVSALKHKLRIDGRQQNLGMCR